MLENDENQLYFDVKHNRVNWNENHTYSLSLTKKNMLIELLLTQMIILLI